MRVFSGVQPSGDLHLGNYLGAIRNFVPFQDSHEALYCVVDMHAITVWQDPKALYESTIEVSAAYLAAGINPKKSVIFNQSQVSGHAELAWIFNCVTRLGWLNRMTQFKDKAGKHREQASSGLYVYPNLMAADILLYKATHVPVGEDQKQHIELTRDIAQKFNHDYEVDFFPLVTPYIQKESARIMSLRDGTKKMSKSDASDMSRISLRDDADTIAMKIRKAKTDPDLLPDISCLSRTGGFDEDFRNARPEAANLLNVYALATNQPVMAAVEHFSGKQFSALKSELSEALVALIAPMSHEMRRLMDDKTYVTQVLREGASRASAIAAPILRECKDIIGFVAS